MQDDSSQSSILDSQLYSTFSQLLILLSFALIIYVAANIGQLMYSIQHPEIRLIESVWTRDLHNLHLHQSLPVFWNQIRVIEKIPANNDSLAKAWAEKLAVPVEINPTGDYKLEILIISQNEPSTQKILIQHHLIHIPSGNSIWELARTYTIDSLDNK